MVKSSGWEPVDAAPGGEAPAGVNSVASPAWSGFSFASGGAPYEGLVYVVVDEKVGVLVTLVAPSDQFPATLARELPFRSTLTVPGDR